MQRHNHKKTTNKIRYIVLADPPLCHHHPHVIHGLQSFDDYSSCKSLSSAELESIISHTSYANTRGGINLRENARVLMPFTALR